MPTSKAKRKKQRKRKRVSGRLLPIRMTTIALPRKVREMFQDYADENGLTLSHAVVLYIVDTLEGKRGIR
jgi:hypothetical protein